MYLVSAAGVTKESPWLGPGLTHAIPVGISRHYYYCHISKQSTCGFRRPRGILQVINFRVASRNINNHGIPYVAVRLRVAYGNLANLACSTRYICKLVCAKCSE